MELAQSDLLKHLQEQIEFLHASSASYDSGFISEAKRLAVVCRVLLHDTDNSTSLLKLLNRKNIDFFNTAYKYNTENLLPNMCLIKIVHTAGEENNYSGFAPLLHEISPNQRVPKRSFKYWWSKQIILDDSKKNRFTRKDIVLGLSNKDGGAHIDPKLNDKYANLTRQNSLGWKHYVDKTEETMYSSELASMRQIAHEVLLTLHDEFPQYIV